MPKIQPIAHSVTFLRNRHWHTTNTICWFSFEILETLTCLFTTSKKNVVILNTTAYNELEVANLQTAVVDMCQCI